VSAHHHDHHDHHHADDFDWDTFGDHLEREGELLRGAVEAAAGWLRERHGGRVRRILDVGSGPGMAAALFARVFPGAEVVAVDGSAPLLERARARGVAIRQAELPRELADLGGADLVWTSRFVHHLGDQQAALDELARRLHPGGLLAVSEGGLPLRFLPRDIGIGRPGLQARLDAANEEWFAAMRAELPDATETVEDWPAMLARTGSLTPVGSRTFLTEHRPPLPEAAREQLHAYLTRMRETVAESLATDDGETLDALLDPDAPTGIRHRPDAFYLTATTVHAARVD
jgi:SAM-dependent methyltransferase